jgi:uroporphyrinogen decarboxylase
LEFQAPGRFPGGWSQSLAPLREANHPVCLGGGHLCGFFSFLRELIGEEELFYLLTDDPDLVREMIAFQTDRLIRVIRTVTAEIRVDVLFIWEDMCFKNGPLIGPEMFRAFFLEGYQKTIEAAQSCGIQAVDLDSDGNVWLLLPLWIEAGVTLCHPFEVAAGMDVNEVQKVLGGRIGLRGGVDKRALARDRQAIELELARIRPAYEAGRYIPHLDHSAPPGISWDHFRYYRNGLAKLVGF